MRRIGIGGNRMIESKVIEKFMEDNGLEPYDAFDVDGELKKYNPCYFTEELELRSMYLDFKGADSPLCTIWLHRLLTGKDRIKHKRTEVVAEEKKNIVCKVSVKGYVMSDEELDYLRKACHLASNVAFENDEKNIYRKLNEYLITGERS
mgnify:FL=1